jgi:acyl-CoA thioesterase-1
MIKKRYYLWAFIVILACDACQSNEKAVPYKQSEMDFSVKSDSVTYLALGDSYTIGESVDVAERYPVQIQHLVNLEAALSQKMSDPKIIATTGWTTDELQQGISEADLNGITYDFVSLLIGVNNQYRGYPIDQYKKEFEELLESAVSFADTRTSNVLIISIPDYGVTPFGQEKDPEKIARELDQYNSIAAEIAANHLVDFISITEISREALHDPSLVAGDQLHPSGLMYKRWVEELLYPWFLEKLKQ